MDSQSEFSVFPDLNESDMSLFELNNLILCVSLCVCVCMSVWRPPLAAWRVMSMSWASCSQPGGGNQTRQQRPQAGSLKARRTPSPLNLDGLTANSDFQVRTMSQETEAGDDLRDKDRQRERESDEEARGGGESLEDKRKKKEIRRNVERNHRWKRRRREKMAEDRQMAEEKQRK